jgi:hypothetical protein
MIAGITIAVVVFLRQYLTCLLADATCSFPVRALPLIFHVIIVPSPYPKPCFWVLLSSTTLF